MDSEKGVKIFDMVTCITNYQKEIEDLKKINEEHRKLNGELRKEIEVYQTMYFDKVTDINNAIAYMEELDGDYEWEIVSPVKRELIRILTGGINE